MMTEFEAQDRLKTCDEKRLGMFGESLWSAVFHSAGLRYIQLCRIQEGGAPMQRSQNGNGILPDFEVSSCRFTLYADSKAKRSPVSFRKAGGELRHGIEKRHLDHYRAVSGMNRKHCAIAVVECFNVCPGCRGDRGVDCVLCRSSYLGSWSGSLLLQTIDRLGVPCSGFGTMSNTVFFPRQKFEEVGCVSALDAIDICNRHAEAEGFRERIHEILESGTDGDVQGLMF